nr:transposase [Caenispirillum salinarum]
MGQAGTRPSAPHDQRTSSAYIFGAICPERSVGAALVLPRCDTHAMQRHLEQISNQVRPGAHAALILVRVVWDTTSRLAVPSNIALLPLPPRAPELNLVENIWQFLRDNWLSNRIFSASDQIVALCCDAWPNLTDRP